MASTTTRMTLSEFYPFYLSQHSNRMCRRLHLVGSSCGIGAVSAAVMCREPLFILYGLLAGYACAWIGHFFFEKNKPATFQYPLFSFVCDWKMLVDMLRGRISW